MEALHPILPGYYRGITLLINAITLTLLHYYPIINEL